MRTSSGFVDVIVYVGGQFLVFAFWMLIGREISPQFFGVWVFASAFAWTMCLKALWRGHVILKRISWSYIILMATCLMTVAFLLSDWSVLGFWTVPTIVLLGVAGFLIAHFLGPRFGDDAAKPSD